MASAECPIAAAVSKGTYENFENCCFVAKLVGSIAPVLNLDTRISCNAGEVPANMVTLAMVMAAASRIMGCLIDLVVYHAVLPCCIAGAVTKDW